MKLNEEQVLKQGGKKKKTSASNDTHPENVSKPNSKPTPHGRISSMVKHSDSMSKESKTTGKPQLQSPALNDSKTDIQKNFEEAKQNLNTHRSNKQEYKQIIKKQRNLRNDATKEIMYHNGEYFNSILFNRIGNHSKHLSKIRGRISKEMTKRDNARGEKNKYQDKLKKERMSGKDVRKEFEKQQKLFKSELKTDLKTQKIAGNLTKNQYKAKKKELYAAHGIESTSKWKRMGNSAAKSIHKRLSYLHRNITRYRTTRSQFDVYQYTGFYLPNQAYLKITE